MDLSKLSDADLAALSAGKLADVSDAGLQHMNGEKPDISLLGQIGQKSATAPRLEGFLRGIKDPLDGAAQLFEHAMPASFNSANHAVNNWLADKTGLFSKVPERNLSSLVTGGKTGIDGLIESQEKEYQAKRAAAGQSGFDGARLGGNILSPINLAIAARAPQAASLMGKLATGAATGAGVSALAPVESVDFWKEKGIQAAMGAGFGAAVPAVASALGRVISPKASLNPDVQLLKNEGVQPTIGQTLGGWANSFEEKAQSIPILGDAINFARGKAREQFNTAAINRASGNVGARVEGAGQESVMNAGNAISSAYESGKSRLGHFQIDQIGAAELQNLKQMTAQLAPKEQGVFQQMWDKLQGEITPNGSVTAESFKKFDGALNDKIGRFGASRDAYQQDVADAFKELQRVLMDNAKRANPEAAEILKNADRGWANLVPVEKAAGAAVNHKGIFTPSQLNLAIRGTDQSVRDRATARGTAIMQDLGNASQAVLGNKINDSGTTGRLLLGTGALASYMLHPAIPLALGAGAAAYSSPLQSALRAAVSSRPQAAQSIAEILNQASPALIPAAAQTGLQFRQ